MSKKTGKEKSWILETRHYKTKALKEDIGVYEPAIVSVHNHVAVLHIGGQGEPVMISGSSIAHTENDVFDIIHRQKVQLVGDSIGYNSKMELVEFAHEGVKASVIERLADLLKISVKEATRFFHFSERSLRSYIKEDKLLDPDSSEKILKIFSLYLYGCEVFGNENNFINWIYKPSFGLRNKIPVDLLYSSDGIDLVHDELARIEHGDLA